MAVKAAIVATAARVLAMVIGLLLPLWATVPAGACGRMRPYAFGASAYAGGRPALSRHERQDGRGDQDRGEEEVDDPRCHRVAKEGRQRRAGEKPEQMDDDDHDSQHRRFEQRLEEARLDGKRRA